MIQWKKRCKKDTTSVSTRRHWESTDNTYRVTESICIYGPKEGPNAIPTIYYAMHNRGWWDIISRHRKRSTAITACEQHAKAKAKANEPRKRKRRTKKHDNTTPQTDSNPRISNPPTTDD